MHKIEIELSDFLWDALRRQVEFKEQTQSQIVSQALAQYFENDPETIFQVSTSMSLVEGVYRGAVPISILKQHGDLGLGTFEDLDGELIAVDGKVFQAKGDGSVHQVSDDVKTPFAVMTKFTPANSQILYRCQSYKQIQQEFDKLRESANLFYALKVEGLFERIHVRAVCKTGEGVPLVKAAEVQPEFTYTFIEGTMVGFWSPEYAKSINVPGYHMHFLSKDQTKGGHVLECSSEKLKLQLHKETKLSLVLPETQEFLKAHLAGDPSADLEKAEKSSNQADKK
jgi:acetolactate decarboxylase